MITSPAPDAVAVTVLGPYVLRIRLDDGRVGTFDVGPLLHLPAWAALADLGYFRRALIAFGVVSWPDGEDLAPETVSARLQLEPGAEDRLR